MRSYLIRSFYFIYNSKLYRLEEWDEDYRGCCTYVNEVDDFVTALCLGESWPDVPVVVDMSAVKDKDRRTGMIFQNLHESSGDLLRFVTALAEKNVLVYPKCSVLHHLPSTSLSAYARSFKAYYNLSAERSTRLDFLRNVFGASRGRDSSSYIEYLVLYDHCEYRIRVLCPEYIVLQDTSSNQISVLDLRGVKEATVYDYGGVYIPALGLKFVTHSQDLDYDRSKGRTAVISC